MPSRAQDGFTDVETAAWSGLLAVHSLVTRQLDAMMGAEQGLALVEYEVLLKLAVNGGEMRMSDLADVAFLSRSGLTRIVDELEALELVRREPDENDGRVSVATLTPLGRRRFAAARRTHRADVRQLFFRYLTEEQQRTFADGWQQILSGLAEDLPSPRPGRRAGRVPGQGGGRSARKTRPLRS
jgi:DNA-binding MarR family transcriptional regulator